MKRRTTVVTVALAAVAMVAAFSTASASARTVYCSSPVTTCPSSGVQPAGSYLVTLANTAIEPGVAKFTLKAGFLNEITCKSATISHKSTAVSGDPLPAELSTSFGLAGCGTQGKEGSCTSITTNKAPETVQATGSGGGTVHIGTEASPMTFSFDCFNKDYNQQQACTYKAADVVQTITPRTEQQPAAKITEAKLTKVSQTKGESPACASTATLNMVGRVEGETYISSRAETVFCESIEPLTNCPSNQVAPAGSYLVTLANTGMEPGVAKFVFKGGLVTEISCKNAILSHQSTAVSGVPLPGQLAPLLNSCGVPGKVEGSCSSITSTTPPETLEATGSGGGNVRIGTEASPWTISFDCFNPSLGEQQACTYKASNVLQTITPRSGEQPAVKITEAKFTKVSQTKGVISCTSTATLNMVGRVENETYLSLN